MRVCDTVSLRNKARACQKLGLKEVVEQLLGQVQFLGEERRMPVFNSVGAATV